MPLVRAMSDYIVGRLDEAAAHLAVAESYAQTALPDRRRRLGVAIAALRVSLARRRGHLAGVLEQVKFLASPLNAETGEDIALGSDLRVVALLNLGVAEAWSPGGLGRVSLTRESSGCSVPSKPRKRTPGRTPGCCCTA